LVTRLLAWTLASSVLAVKVKLRVVLNLASLDGAAGSA